MLQRYSVRLRIYSWFMKYCLPKLASMVVIAGDVDRHQQRYKKRRKKEKRKNKERKRKRERKNEGVGECNTRFIKGHKPSNHIRARIKSHVYTTEWTVYHSTYHVKRYDKVNTNVIYYINDKMSDTAETKYKYDETLWSWAGRHRDVDWETNA